MRVKSRPKNHWITQSIPELFNLLGDIESFYGVDSKYVSERTRAYRGSFLTWFFRQIMLNDWEKLSISEKKSVIKVMGLCLDSPLAWVKGASAFYATGEFRFKRAFLNSLMDKYCARANPFNFKLDKS